MLFESEVSHDELVKHAKRWLMKTRGCGFVLTELVSWAGEIPDAIGFRDGRSILVECKVSRNDFLSDRKKRFRAAPELGMGAYRYYLCPEGVIYPSDLPGKWGLLWLHPNGKVRQKVGPKGKSTWYGSKEFYFQERNKDAEITLMGSALRRLYLRGVLDQIYEQPWDKEAGLAGGQGD